MDISPVFMMKTIVLIRAITRIRPFLWALLTWAICPSQAAAPPSWQGPGIGLPAANPGNLDFLPGQLAGTCFSRVSNFTNTSDPEGFVIAFFDTRDPIGEGAVPGNLWRTDSNVPATGPFYRYHGDQLRAKNIGEVFGVCVSRENNPDIWVSGTSAYASDASSWDPSLAPNNTLPAAPAQRGLVYRIDGTTGAPVDVVALNTAPIASGIRPAELGNLCWDRSDDGTDWVYVSNLNDGLIYRLEAQNLQGSQLTFDHGVDGLPNESLPVVADVPATEFTPDNRFVWGVQIRPSDGRLFYAVWNGAGVDSEVWSVDLDASTGAFLPATAQRELTVPLYSSYRYPIASLSFGADGNTLYAAERGHRGRNYDAAHVNRILEWTFDPSGPSWDLDPQITSTPTHKYYLGAAFQGQNSAGGVQPDCNGNLWVTGNFYSGTSVPGYVYGAQRIPNGGNFATVPEQQGSTSIWIDYNDDSTKVEKYAIGALAMWKPCACMNIDVEEIDCPDELDQDYQITLNVTNLIDRTATIGWLRPCPQADLPAGAVTTTPTPSSLFNLNNPIGQNQSTTIPFTIGQSLGGHKVYFTLTLFDDRMEECCTEKFCIDVPPCDCAEILKQEVVSEQLANGDVKHTITLTVRNMTHLSANPYPFYFVTVPPQPGFVTFDAVPNPNPILPGNVGTATFCYLCPLIQQPCPDKIQTLVGFHDSFIENCCSIEVCIELNPVGKVVEKDTCNITPQVAILCFDADRNEWYTNIRATICNNFCEERTYDLDGKVLQGAPPSMVITGPAQVGPIPPGGCRTVDFRISGQFQSGQQANYEIIFTPTDGGPPLICGGTVVNSPDPVKFVDDNPGGIRINAARNDVVTISYIIENSGDVEADIPLDVSSQFGAFLVSVNSAAPEHLTDFTVVTVPANSSRVVKVQIRLADPTRRDLPAFVDLDLVRLDGALISGVSTSVMVEPLPDGAGKVRCVGCKAIQTGDPAMPISYRLTIEVLSPSATVQVEQTATLERWSATLIRSTSNGPAESELTFPQGLHEIYIDHPGSWHCFFRTISE
jgi:hypothetical protein